MKATQTTVLGKRKATTNDENFVLLLSPSPSTSALPSTSTLPFPERLDSDSSSKQASDTISDFIIINGKLVPHTKKCYRCTHLGCDKAYTKPSRLEEHERTHTGQRPFVCVTCGKSYLRETHLHAHARSHLPDTARPLACERPGCEKRFWTSQHLQVHHSWHDGAKPYKCTEENCSEAFPKHHLLRAHICSEHAPPGTKPYRCSHENCTKSFNTNQHLLTHQKTHDDKRYTCVHVKCLANDDQLPRYFPTWSALQTHIRTDHPPTCSHPSCNGRTFSTQANLKNHIKLHEQREVDMEVAPVCSGDESEGSSRKKRRGGEHGREWLCEYPDCGKDFKSKKAKTTHINVKHLGKRDFICEYPDCKTSFGYKHLLQRHLAKYHCRENARDTTNEELSEMEDRDPIAFDIDVITGHKYAQNAQARLQESKALRCPFPFMHDLTGENPDRRVTGNILRECDYVFNRGYDLRRHLDASHDIVLPKETIDVWVKQQKKAWQSH
uniref:C2H2-type domain-containing protein n=1 Tax=Psilocybe cubensis TaxID=181762 RepID=A0A8H7Y7H7_PSICU